MAAATVMALRGVRKTYRLGEHVVPALQGVDLDVRAGELLALTGPSGSGKSTILNLCGLIDSPDEGQVLLHGQPVDARQTLASTLLRRDTIGFVFQSFNLVPVMTVTENVDYPLFLAGVPSAERRARVAEALAQVGLSEHAAHRPDALSGGQRQRVAMARALVKRPSLVIADEPTASLDSHTAEQVLGLMRSLAHEAGAAFLIATHDDRLTRRCDRVISLLDGRIVPTASHEAHAHKELAA
ncbi:ABC transporter ATP-binding protein [Mitsuaria sp. WAJ17]|uniref:ABC transporter ATP-binding protein n=1 Tax=Mitsuaria sp. WAJ17 TaxID=2761452 RepID=UPI001602BB3F|nr:ABC transporter ATP-binding protein [Mitsuaria sp. WAJ17]MBB2484285.1 ABC transporter ATP-binding protein [Mitsuaria sp. WAJ17]